MRHILSALLAGVLFFCGAVSQGAQVEYRSARMSNAFLDVGVGARGVALGEAFTGAADDVSSLYWNPAGLGHLRAWQVQLMHNLWFAGISQEFAACAIPLGRGTAGVSVSWFNYGELTRADEFGRDLGQFNAYDLNPGIGYGQQFSPFFSGGAALYIPVSMIDDSSQISFALTLGAQYQLPSYSPLTLGLTVRNLGSGIGHGSQPSQVLLGAAWTGAFPDLRLSLDLGKRLAEDVTSFNLGAEYNWQGLLWPRLGYHSTNETSGLGNGLAGLSAGVGYHQPLGDLVLILDYAFVPYGDLGATHRLAISVEFGSLPAAQPSAAVPAAAQIAPAKAAALPPKTTAAPVQAVKTEKAPEKASPPAKVKAKTLGPKIKLSWQPGPSAAAGYQVFMKSGAKGRYERLNAHPVQREEFTTKTLKRKRTYYFQIKAVDRQGRLSEASPELKVYLK